MARARQQIVLGYGHGPKIAPGQTVGQAGLALNPPVYPGTYLTADLWAATAATAAVISSRCSTIMYDKTIGLGALFVTFKDGTTCQYDDVPKQLAKDMFNCTSIGSFVTQRLKGWPYTVI